MAVKEGCLDHTLSEVEELTGAVRLLKSELADQPAALKLAYGKKLEYIRSRFGVYKSLVEQLEEAPEEKAGELHDSAERVWKELKGLIDGLLLKLA